MKTKFLALFLALVTVLGTFAIPSFASEQFTDVPKGEWYHDAVYTCVEKKLFTGTSDTTFSPNLGMTRAMFVTVLASQASFNKADYKTSSFKDVKAGMWYSENVEWAYKNGFVSGTGNGNFSPDKTVTRQELVAMLYKYGAYLGLDMTKGENLDITSYPDYTTVDSWAIPGFKWAIKNGLVSGIKSGEDTLLAPKATSTRAMVALIMVNLFKVEKPDTVEAGEGKLSINGNDISLYRIVKPTGCISSVTKAADDLASFIETATGVSLEVVTDAEVEQEYEILVGLTSRECDDIDRESMSDLEGVVKVEGNKIFFAGAKDVRKRDGTLYSVYFFAERELGFKFYQDECIICRPHAALNLADGYEYKDAPAFEARSMYMQGAWEDCFINEDYYSSANWVHELYNWVYGGWGDYNLKTPCLTKQENVDKIVARAKEFLASSPNSNALWISMNDSDGFCTCESCKAAYREDGTKGATLIRLCNIVADAIKDEYPDVVIFNLAYNYAIKPPKVTKPRENIITYYCMISNCVSHAYNDESCSVNKQSYENITGWNDISTKLYIWDYSANFSYCLVPFPNLYGIKDNMEFFYNNKVRGFFVNAVDRSCGEFSELRAYLLDQLMNDPTISDEEYFDLMNSFIRDYYGDNDLSIRRYIDIIEEMSNKFDFGFNNAPSTMYDYDEVVSRIDEIEALWANAYEEAEGDEEKTQRVDLSYQSWLYLKQCASHEAYMVNGTPEQQNEYRKNNETLYQNVKKYNIGYKESSKGDFENIKFTPETSPENW